MPSFIAGNLALKSYVILDLSDAPLTGMHAPADVTLTLLRQSGSTMIAASETVSLAEIGATGTYYVSFTPQFTGLYTLYLREINVLTALRQQLFDFEVFAAGAVTMPSYANAFCAESDVERYLLQPIDTTTKPNDIQAAGWAEGGAAALMSLMAGLGSSVTPSTTVPGSRLTTLLREANAIFAALYATIAQVFGTGTSKTEKAEALLQEWERYYGKYVSGEWVPGLIGVEISSNTVSLGTNHTLSGDTIPRDNSNPPQDVGFQVTMTDIY